MDPSEKHHIFVETNEVIWVDDTTVILAHTEGRVVQVNKTRGLDVIWQAVLSEDKVLVDYLVSVPASKVTFCYCLPDEAETKKKETKK